MQSRIESKNEKPWAKETSRPSVRHSGQHKFTRMMNDDSKDAFRSVSRKPGLQIWTINNMEMVPVPSQAFGNFFEGDCYIVLHISLNKNSGQSSDIHYWIGNASSQDEQGAAAIYVTQLDEHLGGSPVQHREVQGSESARFRGYFKNGIIFKKGGVASGFHHVDTNAYNILRLLHVKGRKHVTATEVEVSWNSFNAGDIFLLDMGKAIVQWNGPQSNRREKLKAVLLAQDIRDRERGGRAQIGVVEGGAEKDSPELMKIMTAVLGQRTGQLNEAVPDDKPDPVQNGNVRLYHVFENSGNLVVQEVATQPLTQDLLSSSDCYIVDNRGSAVMVWKGKKASKEERHAALNRAVGFIKAKNYPPSTSVEVMGEGGESAMFKHLFKSWREKGQTQGLGSTYSPGKIAKVDQVKFDVMELHARPEVAAQQRMVDDATGDVKVWRIEDLELAEVKPSTYGQFYGGDCYLVLYSYQRVNKQQYILYMWQGRHSTADEITACAYQAVNVDNKYNGAPVQVRVIMGKEPRHFLAIFKGKLIIFEGGTGRAGVVNPESGARLFQVRGTTELNTKATEVMARSSSLNTNDVFLLKTDRMCYLWYGKGCSGDERVVGRAVSDVLSRQDKQVVMEGQEPAEFWVALGGKAPYACEKRLQKEEPPHSPRLFECSNQTGRFRMTEVDDFAQSDLDEEDVMLLDTWEEVFLWIGNLANQYETKEAWNCAMEYLRTHPAGRDPDTPLICVKEGYEPPTFTGWFNAWDPHKWSGGNSYEEMIKKLGDAASLSDITLDLNKTNLKKSPVVTDGGGYGGGYGAPGGPVSSPPVYRIHGGDPSQKPTSPPSQRPRSSVSTTPSPSFGVTLSPRTSGVVSPSAGGSGSPSAGGSGSPSAGGSGSPSAGGSGPFIDPQLLLHKTPSELPQGVDPSLREDFLSDVEFENLLGTNRADFKRLPKWRQSDLKKKAGLF
ncbi:villin-1 [Genypterus blacodes]|uniref:villin-1 n=1 Tax=Genypterus blacodes TaxID=154954 RepID=UPI003F75923C